MRLFKKNIFIASSPNMERDDVWLAFKLLLQPWKWRDEKPVIEFEKQIENYLGVDVNGKGSQAVAFDSARSAFYLLLKAYGIGEGDEVLMPSFTCVVVVNSVIHAGAVPVYVDIDPKTFNIDPADLARKFHPGKTKAILVQHTFGIPIDIEKVRSVVGPDVKIIEDLAHILGGEIAIAGGKKQKFGTFGDAAILTFGIEKMISSVRGGMAVTKDEKIYQALKAEQKGLPDFFYSRILIWLVNPIIWAITNPLYYVGIGRVTFGRIVSKLGHLLGLMGNMMEKPEYSGGWPDWMPAKMPGALAEIGMKQLKKLDRFNDHRRKIAKVYDEVLGLDYSKQSGYTPLRYPILITEPGELQRTAKLHHIILGNWYGKILFTKEEYLPGLNFEKSQNPNTVQITEKIVNLPLYIKVTEEDAKKIGQLVKAYVK